MTLLHVALAAAGILAAYALGLAAFHLNSGSAREDQAIRAAECWDLHSRN